MSCALERTATVRRTPCWGALRVKTLGGYNPWHMLASHWRKRDMIAGSRLGRHAG